MFWVQNISGCLCAGENSPIGLLGETDNALGRGKICRAKSSSGTGGRPRHAGMGQPYPETDTSSTKKGSLWITGEGRISSLGG